MKQFKCESCGSTKYTQTREDKFKCNYCGAEFDKPSVEKIMFNSSISKLKYENNIKYIDACISEDNFYQKALAYLSMNKFTPSDILSSKFNYVKYRYVFFAVFDIEYYSIEQGDFKKSNKSSINLKYSQDSEMLNIKTMCIKLTDCTKEQESLITDNFDESLNNVPYTTSMPNIKDKINCPNENEIQEYIVKTANKEKQLVQFKFPTKDITYKISNVEILAIPEYSLQYTYKDTVYTLYSYAHKLNIVGNMPASKEYTKRKNKAFKLSTIISILMCLSIISFSLSHLLFFKLYSYLSLDLILLLSSCSILIIHLILNVIITRKVNKQYFNEKKKILLNYFSQHNIKTNINDEEFINSFLRRY